MFNNELLLLASTAETSPYPGYIKANLTIGGAQYTHSDCYGYYPKATDDGGQIRPQGNLEPACGFTRLLTDSAYQGPIQNRADPIVDSTKPFYYNDVLYIPGDDSSAFHREWASMVGQTVEVYLQDEYPEYLNTELYTEAKLTPYLEKIGAYKTTIGFKDGNGKLLPSLGYTYLYATEDFIDPEGTMRSYSSTKSRNFYWNGVLFDKTGYLNGKEKQLFTAWKTAAELGKTVTVYLQNP